MKLNKLHATPRGLRFVHQTLTEEPGAIFSGQAVQSLEFLYGEIVDLGFENLELTTDEVGALIISFTKGGGIGIPNTSLKMRRVEGFDAVIEPADGTELVLPSNWKKAVMVVGPNNKLMWVGHLVRDDKNPTNAQYKRSMIVGYVDNGEAFVPPTAK